MGTDDVAYCAGLYEGEGTVGTYISKEGTYWSKERRKYRTKPERAVIGLRIRMTDLFPLQLFQDTFDAGYLGGPYKNGGKDSPEHYKDVYFYQVQNFEHVQYIMVHLWPWLSRRRKDQYAKAVKQFLAFGKEGVS